MTVLLLSVILWYNKKQWSFIKKEAQNGKVMYAISLIKRRKINGLGEHFAVQFGFDQILDIHLSGLKVVTMKEFSLNNKYPVTTEITRELSPAQFAQQILNMKKFRYGILTGTYEQWARQFVEGKFLTEQVTGLHFY